MQIHGHGLDTFLNSLQQNSTFFMVLVDSLSCILVGILHAENIMTFYCNIFPSTVLLSEIIHNLKEIAVFFL